MKITRNTLIVWSSLFVALAFSALLFAYSNKTQIKSWLLGYRTVIVNSNTLSIRDIGKGFPTAVIVSGMACNQDLYRDLQDAIGKSTRVITYDRPGLGRSPNTSEPKTLPYIDKDLKALLVKQGVPPPYILIGHSLGGHIIRYFAHQHPDEVAGMVFLDHPHEDWFKYIRSNWSKQEVDTYFKFWSKENPSYSKGRQQELLTYEKNCELVRGIEIDPTVPVLMFTANNTGHFRKGNIEQEEDRKMYLEMQSSLLTDVVDVKHIVDWGMGHTLHRDKPELVAEEIIAFIEKIKTNFHTLEK